MFNNNNVANVSFVSRYVSVTLNTLDTEVFEATCS